MEPRPTPDAPPSSGAGEPAHAPEGFELDAPTAPPEASHAASASHPASQVRRGTPARPVTWIRMAWFFYGVVALFALGFALFSGHVWKLLGESQPTAAHLLAAMGLACLVVVACHVAVRVGTHFVRASEAAARILGPLRLRDVLVLALLSGFAEELLFRGALWPTLGLAGTTLLFGLVHLVPKRDLWMYPLFAAAVGLMLGLLRQYTESVVPAMVAHAVINGLNLAWLSRVARMLPEGQDASAGRA